MSGTEPLFRSLRPASPGAGKGCLLRGLRRTEGFTLMEVLATMAVTVIAGASVIASLLTSQTYAAQARLLTNARVVVQRNIDTALGVSFTSVSTPDILAVTTGTNGSIFTDQATGSGDNIPIAVSSDGQTLVSGTLRRIVTNLTNAEKPADVPTAIIRRITFRIEYAYLGRDYSYSISTLRSQDDQSQ